MSSPNNFNQQVIEEFRANGGKVNGYFANTPMLLLTTTGAKSDQLRTTPLAYVTDNDRLVTLRLKQAPPPILIGIITCLRIQLRRSR